MTRAICKPELWGYPKGTCLHPRNCTCFPERQLRSDLTDEQKQEALRIGRIEFKSAGATRYAPQCPVCGQRGPCETCRKVENETRQGDVFDPDPNTTRRTPWQSW